MTQDKTIEDGNRPGNAPDFCHLIKFQSLFKVSTSDAYTHHGTNCVAVRLYRGIKQFLELIKSSIHVMNFAVSIKENVPAFYVRFHSKFLLHAMKDLQDF